MPKEQRTEDRSQKSEAVKRLKLEDHGQDFLWWDIDENGVVVDCGPFQAWIWVGSKIHGHEILKAGDMILFTSPNVPGLRPLNYPIEQIINHEGGAK